MGVVCIVLRMGCSQPGGVHALRAAGLLWQQAIFANPFCNLPRSRSGSGVQDTWNCLRMNAYAGPARVQRQRAAISCGAVWSAHLNGECRHDRQRVCDIQVDLVLELGVHGEVPVVRAGGAEGVAPIIWNGHLHEKVMELIVAAGRPCCDSGLAVIEEIKAAEDGVVHIVIVKVSANCKTVGRHKISDRLLALARLAIRSLCVSLHEAQNMGRHDRPQGTACHRATGRPHGHTKSGLQSPLRTRETSKKSRKWCRVSRTL